MLMFSYIKTLQALLTHALQGQRLSVVEAGAAGSAAETNIALLDRVLRAQTNEASLENVSCLHGFLTALVSAPRQPMAEVWMPEIWGGTDYQPQWSQPEEAKAFHAAVLELRQTIIRQLTEKPGQFEAVFTLNGKRVDVSDWCFGYLAAVELDLEGWESMPDALQEHLEFLDEHSMVFEVGHSSSAEEKKGVVSAAVKLHAYWQKQKKRQ